MALKNREIVEISRYDRSVALLNTEIERSNFLPTLDFYSTISTLDSVSLGPYEDQTSVNTVASYNLFKGFRDTGKLEKAKIGEQVGTLNLLATAQDLIYSVMMAYLNSYTMVSNSKVARSEEEALERLYTDSLHKFNLGLLSKPEMLKFKVDLDNAKLVSIAVQASLENALSDLERLCKTRIDMNSLSFAEFSTIPPVQEYAEYEERMLSNSIEIQIAELLVEQIKHQITIERSAYYPTVDVSAIYRRYGDVDLSDLVDEFRGQLFFSINLYRGNETDKQVRKQLIELDKKQLELQEIIDDKKNELTKQYANYVTSHQSVALARSAIEYADENLKVAESKYREGLVKESDLLDALSDKSRANYNFILILQSMFINYHKLRRITEDLLDNDLAAYLDIDMAVLDD